MHELHSFICGLKRKEWMCLDEKKGVEHAAWAACCARERECRQKKFEERCTQYAAAKMQVRDGGAYGPGARPRNVNADTSSASSIKKLMVQAYCSDDDVSPDCVPQPPSCDVLVCQPATSNNVLNPHPDHRFGGVQHAQQQPHHPGDRPPCRARQCQTRKRSGRRKNETSR